MTAVFCRLSGIPPNRATSGFLRAPRSTVASKHLLTRDCIQSRSAISCASRSSPRTFSSGDPAPLLSRDHTAAGKLR
jgi:hypothetical protein